jgi:hypothetical protein
VLCSLAVLAVLQQSAVEFSVLSLTTPSPSARAYSSSESSLVVAVYATVGVLVGVIVVTFVTALMIRRARKRAVRACCVHAIVSLSSVCVYHCML